MIHCFVFVPSVFAEGFCFLICCFLLETQIHHSEVVNPSKTKDRKGGIFIKTSTVKEKKQKEITTSQVIKNCAFSVKEIFGFNKAFTIITALIMLISEALAVFESTYYMKMLIEAIEQHKPFGEVIWLVVIFVGIMLISYCIDKIYFQYYHDIVNHRFIQSFNKRIFQKAGNVELSCYENVKFYNKYTRALDRTPERIMRVYDNAIYAVCSFARVIALLAVMIAIDAGVALFLVFPVIGNFVFAKWLNNIEQKKYKENTRNGRIIDYIMRVLHLQQFSKEMRITNIYDLMQQKHASAVDEICSVHDKYSAKTSFLHWIKWIFTCTIIFEGILLYCSYRALVNGTIDLAEMTIMTSVMTSAAWGIIGGFENIMTIHNEGIYIQNTREFLSYEEKIPEDQCGLPAPKEIEMIEFRNVTFWYDGEEKPTVKNLSFKIEKGKTIAFVGHNGAGKTTLIKLLLRLYDPQSGEILLNGTNIKEYELRSYRKVFSAAFQDYQVIAMSVLENITMGVDFDDADTLANDALRKVGLLEKVESLEHGLNTVMTREFDDNGAVLSGGQNQKLAVARALAQNGKCMVFDEPSSALDPIAEYELFNTIMEETSDKTMIFISHRLSSVKTADTIFMLEHGHIIEQGTHTELMSQNGAYANMFLHQAKSYLAKTDEEAV